MKQVNAVIFLGLALVACSDADKLDRSSANTNASSDRSGPPPTTDEENVTESASIGEIVREGQMQNKQPEPQSRSDDSNISVPVQFRGLYAPDKRACAEDYTYNPAFQNVHVKANEVSFFETGGPVTAVDVEGNNVAITLRETVGDGESVRTIYFALNGDDTIRYRQARSEPTRIFVRCGQG